MQKGSTNAEPGYSLREYLLTLRLANKLADLRVANANQSCDGVATLGENRQGPMTKNKRDPRKRVSFVWQRNLDSNQEQRSQRPVCYPYTIPPLPLRPYILSQRFAFVKCFLKVFCTVLKKAA